MTVFCCRSFLPKEDLDFLREKSLLLPYAPRPGNRRPQQVYLISQHRPKQQKPVSYATSVPPTSSLNPNSTAPNELNLPSEDYDLLNRNNKNHVTRNIKPADFCKPIDEEI